MSMQQLALGDGWGACCGTQVLHERLAPYDTFETPEWVWSQLTPVDLDPCAGANTDIGKVNYALERGQDGLKLPWQGFVFCNPPFTQKAQWAERMRCHGNGVLLLPERGSAPWFSAIAAEAGAYWVMGRKVDFTGGHLSNAYGTVLFLYGDLARNRVAASGLPGHLAIVSTVRPRKGVVA